ncbi:hypothetical protein [uncultured Algibacter sp.]|uniref:hypothetical protein n=1 Tax=uncultured Algibacter sp. TaxID=298659 RepID=UPI0026189553|nr:hypothetical protein [uncultured Algibacter sp.]
MTNKLNILKRKQKGKLKLKAYKLLFKEFTKLEWIDLEKSDLILKELNKKGLQKIVKRTEFINSDENFIESDLLREVYLKLEDGSSCYMFTDDFEYCGMFEVDSKEAFENALKIAKLDENNTCFILDTNSGFSFTINFYDDAHNDYPCRFDIQRR